MSTFTSSWKLRIDKGARRLPYVALVEVDEPEGDIAGFGSGILVDEYHVLTCLHVLDCGRKNKMIRHTTSQPLNSFVALKEQTRIRIGLVNELTAERAAQFLAEDVYNDLALLRLEKPAVGIEAPLGHRPFPSGERSIWILGFEKKQEASFVVVRRSIDLSKGTYVDGALQSGDHPFGCQGGMSGGPVFSEIDGSPVFVGIADIGGLASPSGHFIGADVVRRFLDNHIDVNNRVLDNQSDIARTCFIEGYAKIRTVSIPPITHEFYCLPQAGPDKAAFLAAQPVSAQQCAMTSGGRQVGRGATLLPAHLSDRTQVEQLLERLRTLTGLPLRLPDETEVAAFHFHSAARSRPLGRPALLSDYRDVDGKPLAPPDTTLEWIGVDGGFAPCQYWNGSIRRFDNPRQWEDKFGAHVRATLRLAFTPG